VTATKTVHSKDSWVYVISYMFINNIFVHCKVFYTSLYVIGFIGIAQTKNIMGKQAKSNYGVACELRRGGGEGGVIFHKI
jgi:hypothetical protein